MSKVIQATLVFTLSIVILMNERKLFFEFEFNT